MPLIRLDKRLLRKISRKISKPEKYVRERISKRASRLSISSEAAQVIWAKELGIGTAHFQRTLPPQIQQEIRDSFSIFLPRIHGGLTAKPSAQRDRRLRRQGSLSLAIEFLLTDDELRKRCTDLLRARSHFDRVFREGTTVLEDRLKRLAGINDSKINAIDLVGKVLHPNNAILIVSSQNNEQEGFYFICRGLFQAFRNPTHHQLSDKFTREDALRFCGFLDSLLAVLKQAQKKP
ncbi:MAG: TIGR02391 family protein [Candidatus Bathyarchaeia archaeon]